MPLALQQPAPDFTLPASTGRDFTLSTDLAGRPAILYFYPKDFTAGCTAEACSFRDHFADFRELDVDVVGISRDSVATHQRFIKAHHLPFTLLADEAGQVARRYDALVPIVGITKRVTYLLDAQHRIVAAHQAMFESMGHIRAMLASLKAKA
ncbi:MAG: peroxiredoxin [Bernardetiaceae bacterium]|jgi:peroxiredoxin Q/BCP|nr:peroxiredoxin [Bernardetiaceae bacterium]